MALHRVQHVRHDKAGADEFLGKLAELTVDTTTPEVRLHDGLQPGGHSVALASLANSPAATSGNNGKMTSAQVIQLEDHESRISVNEIDIAQNEVDIAANTAAIAANTADVTNKIDKVPSPVIGNSVKQTADGSLADTGYAPVQMNEDTLVIFPQAAAPDGWALEAGANDRVIRINNPTGGETDGSWVISGTTVDGHALIVGEMPEHQHHEFADTEGTNTDITSLPDSNPAWRWNDSANSEYRIKARTAAGWAGLGEPIGGGQAHSHGFTSNGSWRPAHLDAIVCRRLQA